MSTVTLRWIGDLDQDKREQAGCVSSSSDQYRPKKIELKPGQKEIRIGRINTKIPPDYAIESCINSRMISRNHATIERSAKGGSILYDHSMNGTYVNYTRVMGGVTLKHGDIVCFGHLNGANLKPGEPVALFYSDLKYRVELSDSPTKENVVAGTTKKRKSYPAQPGSTVSSTQRSDGEDDSIGSSDDGSIDAKRPKSNTISGASRSANRQKFKKPVSSNRHKLDEEDDGDSNEDADDNSNNKRMSSASSKAIKKRSNGTEKVKKSHSNSVSRKTSGTKPSHLHNKEKRRSGKSSKSGVFDAEDDAGGSEMFHYDSEECSARPCKQPQDIAIDWIQCDRCTLWYHQVCIGLKPSEANVETYYCPYCKK